MSLILYYNTFFGVKRFKSLESIFSKLLMSINVCYSAIFGSLFLYLKTIGKIGKFSLYQLLLQQLMPGPNCYRKTSKQ